MKKLRKEQSFNNYIELCAALDIVPAKRGVQREAQKAEINKAYILVQHKNNSYTITPKTNKTRKVESGQIVTIDGKEIDLRANGIYKSSHIEDLLLYFALIADGKCDTAKNRHYSYTKYGFIVQCFSRSKLFKELLNNENDAGRKDKTSGALGLVHEVLVKRLSDITTAALNNFERKGLISIEQFYELTDHGIASLEEVNPYIKEALEQLHIKSEFHAHENRTTWEQFCNTRDELFTNATGKIIKHKDFVIHSQIDDLLEYELTNADIQVILTRFFDILRAKAIFEIQSPSNNRKDDSRIEFATKVRKYGKEAIEIINKYCAYMTTVNSRSEVNESSVYYTLDDIPDWKRKITIWYDDWGPRPDISKDDRIEITDDFPEPYDENNILDKVKYNFFLLDYEWSGLNDNSKKNTISKVADAI